MKPLYRFMKKAPSHFSSKMQETNGIVHWLILLMMLILPVTVYCFEVSFLIFRERRIQNPCRAELIQIQKSSALEIQELLALNAEVSQLKLEYHRLELSLVAALAEGNALAAAAIRAQMTVVRASQENLRLQQLFIIKNGELRTTSALKSLEMKMIAEIRKISKWTGLGSFQAQVHRASNGKWALESQDPPYPTYQLKTNFESEQAIHVEWSWKYRSLKADQFWREQRLSKPEICGATLIRKKDQLIPRIHEDKSSLSF